MSLPSSERLPNDINDLPPARQRHIRRQPRSVSLPERQILLDSLIKLTAPTPIFFSRALLGALALLAAFYLQNLAIMILAIVLLPFPAPLFGLALYPVTLDIKHALKSLVSMLLLVLFSLGAGALAGLFQEFNALDPLGFYRFSSLYWLDIAIVSISAFLSVLTLLRQGKVSQGTGTLLSYTLLVPFAAVGFGLSNGLLSLWQGALFVSFVHLGLAIVLAVFSFFILGFPPKKTLGWLVTIVGLTITLAVASAGLNYAFSHSPGDSAAVPSSTPLFIPSESTGQQVEFTPTPTQTISPTTTSLSKTHTRTPSPSSTKTATLTPEPTAFWGVINSTSGAVIRENPDFDAVIITYANNTDLIEIIGEPTQEDGALWFQVKTETGKTGWLLGSLLLTQTPLPTE